MAGEVNIPSTPATPTTPGTSSPSTGGDSFQKNLDSLKQASEEAQAKNIALRALSMRLGADQKAASERPAQ